MLHSDVRTQVVDAGAEEAEAVVAEAAVAGVEAVVAAGGAEVVAVAVSRKYHYLTNT